MSTDGSDDDIPGLESVSSSEYISDDEDSFDDYADPVMPRWVDPKGLHYKTAKRWLEQDRPAIEKHLNVITVYLFSPFLYGHAHQSDRWLRWCQEAGLLISDTDYNTGCLSENERNAVDLLETAMQYCRNTMKDKCTPDALALLLQLAEEVRVQDSYKHAVRLARRRGWFMIMMKEFKVNPVKASKDSQYSVEIGCLYVINQTAEHVCRFVKDGHDFNKEFQEKVLSDEEMGEPLKKSGDDMVKASKHKDAVEEYSTAIICCPYNDKLYTNRALAYMELKDFKSALSDGLRAMVLNPSFPKGYIRYILALRACGEGELMQKISDVYHKRFPSGRDRDLLRKALDFVSSAEKKRIEPSEKDKVLYDTLIRSCRQASEAYLNGNIREAMFYYDEAISSSKVDKGWQNCMVLLECKKFIVSLHFAYGLALLKNASDKSAELALIEFNTIIDEYRNMRFLPAHWGAAKALVLLHRHSHALSTAKNALEQLPLIKLPTNVTWPGTRRTISEALTQNVEANLQKIQISCEPVCVPDAVCRYGNCLIHHRSTHIRRTNEDYKGHVLLACTENCAIAYHSTCWRRFKSDSVINSDRDFLLTPCPTPDCSGDVRALSVFDLKGKCKIKFEPPAKPPASCAPAYQSTKKSKKGSKTRVSSSERALRKKVSSDGGNSEADKEETKTNEDERKLSPDVVFEEEVMDVVKEKVEVGAPPVVSEDVRKLEDRVEVINRHAEFEEKENKDTTSAKPKAKKKKEKKTLETMFSFPDRPARSDTSPEDEAKNKVPLQEPDSSTPFQTPEHLIKVIEQFETIEVPSMGLMPRPPSLVGTTMTTSEKKPSEDFEFIFSYFREIFKSHGGLHPKDSKLIGALSLLPEDKKTLIESTGGLVNFLLMSPSFKSHGELICLYEDAPVIAASIDSNSGSGLSQGAPGGIDSDYGKTKRKKRDKQSSQKDEKDSQSSQVQPHSQSSSEVDFVISPPDVLKSKTYGEELSSGVNSPCHSPLISPRMMSPVLSQKIPDKPLSRPSSGGSLKDTRDGVKTHTKELQRKPIKSNSKEKELGRIDTLSQNRGSQEKDGEGPSLGVYVDQSSTGDGFSLSDNISQPPIIPKRSTSSSGRVNGIVKGSSEEKLSSEWDRQIEKVKSELVTGGGRKDTWGEQKPVLPVKLVSIGINAHPLVTEKWVMTDPIPPVENFKERYESVVKEKKDLHSKLERSEDQRFKMQRDHKRELEKVQKQCKAEAREESQSKIAELERRVSEEKGRVSTEKKDHAEQTRSLKSEIKSLSDKIERMKKDTTRRDQYTEANLIQARGEAEHAQSEKRKMEEQLRGQADKLQVALRRAMASEIDLLNLRRETILRPGEHRLREVDGICATLPAENEYYQEWLNYRDKLKTSLDCFQNAMEDQAKQVRGGKMMIHLDPVPNPAVPLPPQLASFRMPFMRPPFIPMMMRPPPRPLDPSQFQSHPPVTRPSVPISIATGPNPPGALNAQPAAVGVSGFLPSGGQQQSLFNDPSPGASLPSDLDLGGGSKKISSFDRIVEKLSPTYPQFSKTDFKIVLREVRRSNGNTLSGLSLDNIASQIMGILDIRAGKVSSSVPTITGTSKPLLAGGVVSGKGARNSPKGKGKKSLRPVAVAEPPRSMDIEYDNEGWCIICYEDMTDGDSSILNCGHRFHSECIRSWFNEQSTCPTCRNHSLLPDEYPRLK